MLNPCTSDDPIVAGVFAVIDEDRVSTLPPSLFSVIRMSPERLYVLLGFLKPVTFIII